MEQQHWYQLIAVPAVATTPISVGATANRIVNTYVLSSNLTTCNVVCVKSKMSGPNCINEMCTLLSCITFMVMLRNISSHNFRFRLGAESHHHVHMPCFIIEHKSLQEFLHG